MAVEARHMNIFSPQFITNSSRDFIKTNQGIINTYNNPHMDSCVPFVDSMQQQQQQRQQQQLCCNPNISSAKTSINKADSGLTYNMNIPAISSQRKRSRQDSFIDCFDNSYQNPQKNRLSSIVPFDDDVFSQIQQQQQQQDIHRVVSEHMEKVRLELEERRKRQSSALIASIQERVTKKLKEKDEEIRRIGKLNWVLQERVKSLHMENQLWRDLAQANEATANSLRTNLEQVLAHAEAGEERRDHLEDDAESSCGSSDEGWRKVVVVAPSQPVVGDGKCRKCGVKESSVLLLPCRHLCLCTMCGSTVVGTCPVCVSVTNASVHVNMS